MGSQQNNVSQSEDALHPKLNYIIMLIMNYCHKVVQKRFNGKIEFLLPWRSYKEGFGHVYSEYWLGMFENLFFFTYF